MNLTTLDIITPQELKVLDWLRTNELTNQISDFIQRSDAYTRLISGIMGWHWEDEFKTLCELHGFTCSNISLSNRYDLIVNDKKVQCKYTVSTSRVDIRHRGSRLTGGKYKAGDFDVMAIRSRNDIFIVPIDVLLDDTLTQTRSSVKIDEIVSYKDKYEVFNEIP